MSQGILLVNLGTPLSPSTSDVRKYLREFLMDEEVIDINPIGRWFLVNLIIAPFRGPKSAALYREIWTKDGSPLLLHGIALRDKLQEKLSSRKVKLAMRYQQPSIRDTLNEFKQEGITDIIVIPLYPQYATSSSRSTIMKVKEEAAKLNFKNVRFIEKFHDRKEYLDAVLATAARFDLHSYDHVLFSFHGIPERHITKADLSMGDGKCSFGTCCEIPTAGNSYCYRANCIQTARALAGSLNIPTDKYSITFQSRLGRDPWLKPYTDHTVIDLAKSGKKKVLVFCPSFVADCLETIHEISTEYNELFRKQGGDHLQLVPSLNSNDDWVNALAAIIADVK